jgi:hypothetical protein
MTHRHTDTQTDRHKTHNDRERVKDLHTDRQTDRKRHTDRHHFSTKRKTDRHTERQTWVHFSTRSLRERNNQTNQQTNEDSFQLTINSTKMKHLEIPELDNNVS